MQPQDLKQTARDRRELAYRRALAESIISRQQDLASILGDLTRRLAPARPPLELLESDWAASRKSSLISYGVGVAGLVGTLAGAVFGVPTAVVEASALVSTGLAAAYPVSNYAVLRFLTRRQEKLEREKQPKQLREHVREGEQVLSLLTESSNRIAEAERDLASDVGEFLQLREVRKFLTDMNMKEVDSQLEITQGFVVAVAEAFFRTQDDTFDSALRKIGRTQRPVATVKTTELSTDNKVTDQLRAEDLMGALFHTFVERWDVALMIRDQFSPIQNSDKEKSGSFRRSLGRHAPVLVGLSAVALAVPIAVPAVVVYGGLLASLMGGAGQLEQVLRGTPDRDDAIRDTFAFDQQVKETRHLMRWFDMRIAQTNKTLRENVELLLEQPEARRVMESARLPIDVNDPEVLGWAQKAALRWADGVELDLALRPDLRGRSAKENVLPRFAPKAPPEPWPVLEAVPELGLTRGRSLTPETPPDTFSAE